MGARLGKRGETIKGLKGKKQGDECCLNWAGRDGGTLRARPADSENMVGPVAWKSQGPQ